MKSTKFSGRSTSNGSDWNHHSDDHRFLGNLNRSHGLVSCWTELENYLNSFELVFFSSFQYCMSKEGLVKNCHPQQKKSGNFSIFKGQWGVPPNRLGISHRKTHLETGGPSPPATYKWFLNHTTSNISKALGSWSRKVIHPVVVIGRHRICSNCVSTWNLFVLYFWAEKPSKTRAFSIKTRVIWGSRYKRMPLQIRVLVDAANIFWMTKTRIRHLHITVYPNASIWYE